MVKNHVPPRIPGPRPRSSEVNDGGEASVVTDISNGARMRTGRFRGRDSSVQNRAQGLVMQKIAP